MRYGVQARDGSHTQDLHRPFEPKRQGQLRGPLCRVPHGEDHGPRRRPRLQPHDELLQRAHLAELRAQGAAQTAGLQERYHR